MYKYWISLLSAVVISSVSQMLLKRGSMDHYDKKIREYLNVWVISGYFLMVVSTICVIYGYRGIAFKTGTVIESLGYVLVMVLSRIFFGEKITKNKLIGNLLIIIGVIIFCI